MSAKKKNERFSFRVVGFVTLDTTIVAADAGEAWRAINARAVSDWEAQSTMLHLEVEGIMPTGSTPTDEDPHP